MKKVIITGATGFIGGALAKRLLQYGVIVYGVGRNAEKLNALKQFGDFIPVIADFENYNTLSTLIIDKEIDVFYHFAWNGVFGEAFKDYSLQLSNVKCACDAVIQAIKIKCKKFVFAGTANEYEILRYFNNESTELRYTRAYAVCKLAAEIIGKIIAANDGIAFHCGLIAMAYGENNYSKMIPNVVITQLLLEQSPKLITGNNLYDIMYISDIVDAFIAIGEKGKNNKSYYIGHRNVRTFKEIFTDIGNIVNPNIALKFGEFQDSFSLDYSLIDLDALYNDTGWEAKTDFQESVVKTAEWIKTHTPTHPV